MAGILACLDGGRGLLSSQIRPRGRRVVQMSEKRACFVPCRAPRRAREACAVKGAWGAISLKVSAVMRCQRLPRMGSGPMPCSELNGVVRERHGERREASGES